MASVVELRPAGAKSIWVGGVEYVRVGAADESKTKYTVERNGIKIECDRFESKHRNKLACEFMLSLVKSSV